MNDVRDQIKAIIRDRAHIQAEIARRADITPAKLSLILNKRARLDVNDFNRLCAALNVTPDFVTSYYKNIKEG